MALAESFSIEQGYFEFAANVSEDAVGFYEKIGYRMDPDHPGNDPSNPRMTKINRDHRDGDVPRGAPLPPHDHSIGFVSGRFAKTATPNVKHFKPGRLFSPHPKSDFLSVLGQGRSSGLEHMSLEPRWWENARFLNFSSPKSRGLTLTGLTEKLDELKDWSFNAICMRSPYRGGVQYSGLDVIDYYTVDPALGILDDFDELIYESHRRDIAVISFLNLGYAAVSFPPFVKACDDVKAGVDSPESRWFVWSDTKSAELDRSHMPFFLNDTDADLNCAQPLPYDPTVDPPERAGSFFILVGEAKHENMKRLPPEAN